MAAEDINKLRINYSQSCHGSVVIDNVYIGHKNGGATAPEGGSGSEEGGSGTAPGIPESPAAKGIDFNNGIIPATVTGSGTYVTHSIVDLGNGNKALRIVKTTQKWCKAGLFVEVSEVEENADTFLFECDMYVTKYNAMAIYITNPETTTDNNEYYSQICSGGTDVIGFGSTLEGICGKWIHFKLEYKKVDGTGVTTITIDGTSATFERDDSIQFEKTNMIMFAVQSSTVHDVVYDNIVCKKICSAAN